MTDPVKIKIYLYGTNVKTDWKKGSQITFFGSYDGNKYEDKGNVIENKHHEVIRYNYWSGFSGLEDRPENYSTVSYLIKEIGDNCYEFTWHQRGFSNEDGKCHTENGLKSMLKEIKRIAEEM